MNDDPEPPPEPPGQAPPAEKQYAVLVIEYDRDDPAASAQSEAAKQRLVADGSALYLSGAKFYVDQEQAERTITQIVASTPASELKLRFRLDPPADSAVP